jgi:hypothetical protein
MADLRTWETEPEVPIEEKLGIKNKNPGFIRREIRFAIESSEDSGVILPVLMGILLSLPGSAMTTMGLAWLTTISVRMWRPASQQASLPVRKSLERTQRKDPYYLAGCDRKSAGAGHRPWVMPEEEKIVFMILRETGFMFRDLS